MGRFNDGVLMLYLKQQNFPACFYLSTIAVFNFIMLLISPFIGHQIDNNHHKSMLYLTIGALLLFNLFFYQIKLCPWPFAICGLISWGIQRAGAQIVFSALVFKSIPNTMYGTGIGIFYITTGFSCMLSSSICGYLASNNSFQLVFLFSGAFSLLTLFFAMLARPESKEALALTT
jgi:MFS family permease